MNQKAIILPATTTNHGKPGSKDGLHRIEDIVYSDADTFPEFSNRDGSKETVENKHWQLMMVRVPPDHLTDAHVKSINEALTNEMRATWKTPPTLFAYVSAPHVPICNLAHGIAKKHLGDKAAVRASYFFAEPKNDKFLIAKDSELKSLKYEVILGASRFAWSAKIESHLEMSKRIESTLVELMRVLPNVVLFLGPLAFDCLFETMHKEKRRSLPPAGPASKMGNVLVENFRREPQQKWKRVIKHGATSVSVPLC